MGFRDNRAGIHSKRLATDDYGEREGEGARDDESEGFVRGWLAGWLGEGVGAGMRYYHIQT